MNKFAIIWGASGGIGRAITAECIKRDWSVVALSRRPDNHPAGTVLDLEISSVADEFSLARAVMEAGYEIDPASLLIYAVGDINAAPVADMKLGDWERLLEANLTGAYLATHHALPLLSEDATIVYVGAVHERLRLPGLAAYAAAKAGLEAFAETLRKEQRKKKVLVVRPAAVTTPLWEKVPMNAPKNAMSAADSAVKIVDAAFAVDHGRQLIVDL